MAERSNDDIADALRGLAAGDHAEPSGSGLSSPSPAPPPASLPPQPRSPAAPRPAAPLSPGRTNRPAQPTSAGMTPPRAAVPPQPRPVAPVVDENETTAMQPIDEDDAVIVPAAPLSSLGHRPQAPQVRPTDVAARRQRARQTAVPILLTLGVLLLAAAGLRLVVDPDAPLGSVPPWLSLAAAAAGLLFLALAALNLIQSAPPQTAARR